MKNLCDELLINISSFLDNNDSISFSSLNKYNKQLFSNVGYLKNLCFNGPFKDPLEFSELFCKHYKSLNLIYIYHLEDPQYYIPNIWPKKVCLFNLKIHGKINPHLTNTEILEINNYSKKTLNINWKKFQKLKVLFIQTIDINFEGIENCTNLETICIILDRNKKILNINSLPKLKYLLINCNIEKDTNFISKDLRICLFNNYNNLTYKSKSIYPVYNNTYEMKKRIYSIELMYKFVTNNDFTIFN